MRKNILYTLITLSLPLVFLFLLEVGLRLFNYGETFPLFVEDPNNSEYLVVNPEFSSRYFSHKAIAPEAGYYPFLKSKPSNTYRIFVLGESTAAGFPYNHGASFPRQLEFLLANQLKRKVEVINLSMAAINSYTIKDLVDEMLDQEPDHALIYLGHNEYYGALGVGSSLGMLGGQNIKNFYLIFKEFRIVQLIGNVFRSSPSASNLKDDITLMERVVENQQISKGSRVYELGLSQFENNLDEILRKLTNSNVKVSISNLVSNIKDQAPFGYEEVKDQSLSNLLSQLNPSTGGIPDLTRIELDYLIGFEDMYPNHSGLQFLIGRKLLSLDSGSSEAIEYLLNAKDSDLIKFRAPSEINMIIASKASEYNSEFIDMTKFFEANNGTYAPGYEYFTEHLHPNLFGYRKMALAFYSTFSNDEINKGLIIPTYTEVDSVYGELMIARLKENWPFKSGANNVDPLESFKPKTVSEVLALNIINQKISWLEANARLYDEYKKKNNPKMLRAATALSQEFRNIEEPIKLLAEAYLLIGDTTNAMQIIKPKFEIENNEKFGQMLADFYLDRKELSSALSVYKKLIIINPANTEYKLKVKALEEIKGSKNYEKTYLNAPRVEMIGYLGAYLYLGLYEEAQYWLDFLKENFPGEDLKQFESLINSNTK
ncbi:hypothetical protein ACFCT7_16580 [Fulvivirgaceae bacterium LMO-SS25]